MDCLHQVAAAGAAVRGALLNAARDGCAAVTADLAARRAALGARPTELHDFMNFQVCQSSFCGNIPLPPLSSNAQGHTACWRCRVAVCVSRQGYTELSAQIKAHLRDRYDLRDLFGRM